MLLSGHFKQEYKMIYPNVIDLNKNMIKLSKFIGRYYLEQNTIIYIFLLIIDIFIDIVIIWAIYVCLQVL